MSIESLTGPSTIILIIIQLVAFAFGYGKISQKIADICKRFEKMDDRVDKMEMNVNKLEINVTKLEVNLDKLETTLARFEERAR